MLFIPEELLELAYERLGPSPIKQISSWVIENTLKSCQTPLGPTVALHLPNRYQSIIKILTDNILRICLYVCIRLYMMLSQSLLISCNKDQSGLDVSTPIIRI